MKLWTLGSGSCGNATVVECDGERVLFDVGVGPRTLANRLGTIGMLPQSIAACFITHEHADHIAGLRQAHTKWRLPIYATTATTATPELDGIATRPMDAGATVELERVTVQSVRTPHDATDSVGYVVTCRTTGARAALFYDLGHMTPAIRDAARDADILLIESNHDDEMLRYGPYPPFLQARIAGRRGHLSNAHAAQAMPEVVGRAMRHVVLGHLSEKCNTPAAALEAVGSSLRRTRFRGRLSIAKRDGVAGPFVAEGTRETQFNLGL